MPPESDSLSSLAFPISVSHKEVALREVIGFHSLNAYRVREQEAAGSSMQIVAGLGLLFFFFFLPVQNLKINSYLKGVKCRS